MMKKELRDKMKELRAVLLPQAREEAAFRVLQALQGLPEFRQAQTLFCYASVGTELPTAAIAAAHKRVAYPKVLENGEMRFYCGPLLPGFRGIPEPQAGE